MDREERVAKAMFEEASKDGYMRGVWADLKVTLYGNICDGQELWLRMARVAIAEMEND